MDGTPPKVASLGSRRGGSQIMWKFHRPVSMATRLLPPRRLNHRQRSAPTSSLGADPAYRVSQSYRPRQEQCPDAVCEGQSENNKAPWSERALKSECQLAPPPPSSPPTPFV